MTEQGTWVGWSDLPWVSRPEAGGTLVQLCDRMLQAGLEAASRSDFLQGQLPEVASEYSAQWAAVLQRTPRWETLAEFGRFRPQDVPYDLLEDALDHEAAGSRQVGDIAVVAVPVPEALRSGVLVLCGRSLTVDLAAAAAVGHAFQLSLRLCDRQEQLTRQQARLQTALQIATSFAREKETQPLLEHVAREAAEFLNCDRTTIFIWDREQRQVVGCPALGVADGTLRLPDDVGIVGETLQTGQTVRVDDAYADRRFNQEVDRQSGYRTHNILCVPLVDVEGTLLGVFEAMNKGEGGFTADDEESLKQFGTQAAVALENVKEREQLIRSREQLAAQVRSRVHIIGESPAIVALRATIDRLAGTDLPVLILGESGTGKEVAAQALHYRGPRADQPFIAVNCAALTETLLESELFGHEKGAFTDAYEARPGKFELAEGGTIFLDEIGDMSAGGQAALLRVLQEKVITRVGGSQSIPINVRVVAATNTKLAEAVSERKFREDLYYRLSVVTLELPPLRERPEDILALAEHFLREFSVQARRPSLQLSNDARRRLQAHHWPGNVRELRNLMERVAFLCPGERVEANDLAFILSPDQGGLEPSTDVGLDRATRQFQRDFIRRAIKRVGGNMSEAARLLSVHRSNLYRKMRQLKMREVGGEE